MSAIHRRLFTDFCRIEMAAGGPDPQVRLTAEAVRCHTRGGIDLAGLFVVPYSCAGAAILWRLAERKPNPSTWQPWLEQHGKGLPVRKERRPVKGHWGRFTTCVVSWYEWCEKSYPSMVDRPYADVYASVTKEVKYFGRYATMKLLETMYQAGLMSGQQNTIVPRDGKFPRRSMALLMPEHEAILKGKREEAEVDALADRIRLSISDRLGVEVTWFQLETMLCIYGQSLRGKYPAGRHDSELGHWTRTMAHYGEPAATELRQQFPFSDLRRKLYPVEFLGEWNDPGWDGVRDDLEAERKEEVRRALATE